MEAASNRREFKFLIRPELEPILRESIAGFLAPDRDLSSGYVVLTEYFDSPEHLCHWQKIDGLPNRRRLRSRIYVDPIGNRDPVAFIEIKHKLDGITVKRRILSTPGEVAAFSNGGPLAHRTLDGEKVRHEISQFAAEHKLSRRAQIRYHRYAYDNGHEGTFRITFDQDIRCRVKNIQGFSVNDSDFEIPLSPSGSFLMEVKTSGPVPSWFRALCGKYALTPTSFSKYSAAIGTLHTLSTPPRALRSGPPGPLSPPMNLPTTSTPHEYP